MRDYKPKLIFGLLLTLALLMVVLLSGCGASAPGVAPDVPETPAPEKPVPEKPVPEKPVTEPEVPAPPETPEPPPRNSLAFGGPGNDRAADIRVTADGGYVVAGHTNSFGAGDYDAYLVKLDAQDQVVWAQTYGGEVGDYASAVVQTSDGGFACAGLTSSQGSGKYDVYLVKTDADGNLEWEQAYGGAGDDRALGMRQTADDGFLVVGYTDSKGAGEDDLYLLKTDAKGELVWEKTYGGELDDRARFVTPAPEGGYLVVGDTASFAEGKEFSADIYLLKIDLDGNEEWSKTFGTTDTDYGYWLEYTADGGYVIGGYNVTFQVGARDFYITKVDKDGKATFDRSIDNGGYERAGTILLTADGGYLMAGHTETYNVPDSDVWLVKTDGNGEVVWEKTFGGPKKERAFRIQATDDGGYVMAGYTDSFGAGGSDIYIVKIDADGNTDTVEPLALSLEAPPTPPSSASPGSAPVSHAEPGYTCRAMCHHETGSKPMPLSHESYISTDCTTCHVVPEPAPAVTADTTSGDLFVELVSVTDPARPDSDITVTIKTVPGATCTIKAVLPITGTVSNKPIDRTKEADANGEITWTWLLHRHTGAGDGTFIFTVKKDANVFEQSFPFTVKK